MARIPTPLRSAMQAGKFLRDGSPTPGLILESDVSKDPNRLIKYTNAFAGEKLGASAIFELSGATCVYFKGLEREPSSAEIRELHKLAWNHGLAPILWIVSPGYVRIVNCYRKPSGDGTDGKFVLKEFRQNVADLQRLDEFCGRRQFDSGYFWHTAEGRSIDRRGRVDAALLDDLRVAEKRLSDGAGLPANTVHALLGRSIFAAYLLDRGILSRQFATRRFGSHELAGIFSSKQQTYALFRWIKGTFRGDLFPLTAREEQLVSADHLRTLQQLFSNVSLSTGQGVFWRYRFDVIPIELISSIYEMFAHLADSDRARELSTHYTPINLVDFTLSQVFEVPLKANAKVLDPACGSGVFLVECLRRLVARQVADGRFLNRQLIRQVLRDQIFGIDKNAEAIQVAAFSLYLTLLELDPNPQPPSALAFEPLVNRNLFCADTFDEDAAYSKLTPFKERQFDAVVGNPPWTRGDAESASYSIYCDAKGLPTSRDNPDQAFLWRVRDFVADGAVVGLLIHAKPFFSHTPRARDARRSIFKKFRARLLVNFSELRHEELFPTATAPTMFFLAGMAVADSPAYSFTYAIPERSINFKGHGLIRIDPNNIKKISGGRASEDDDYLKVATWGTPRDMQLIEKLRSKFTTLDEWARENVAASGQGFISAGGGKAVPPSLRKMKWLPSGALEPFEIDARLLSPLPYERLHRPRSESIYRAPLVVAPRGIGSRGFFSGISLREDLIYTELYLGFSFYGKERTSAQLLNGILNSSLATYFLFLTGSAWGVERDEIKPQDLRRIPMPSQGGGSEIRKVIEAEAKVRCEGGKENLRALDRSVFDLYGLSPEERILVEDMVHVTIDLRSHRANSAAIQRPSCNDLKEYSQALLSVLTPFMTTLDRERWVANIYDAADSRLQIVRLNLVPANRAADSVRFQQASGKDISSILASVEERIPSTISSTVYSFRNLRVYGPEEIIITKVPQRRYWSRSAGFADGDSILAEHIGGG